MLKDIEVESLEGVSIAVVNELGENMEMVWNVYVINYTQNLLEGVLVSSKGYGKLNGEEVQTSQLRHFLETIEPLSYSKIEPIISDLFVLNNEYWLSYYVNGKMYDRKFVFLENTIKEDGLELVSLLNKPGLLIS
ncbi:MAG: hypothetical protein K9H61_11950 [Bacteroidia bacterium]|nr:hypothetical protein [Bacteroidia bacterium]MCF8427558.1 hypothetical protein [Bacteroidia bacterium]MCF8447699.1 hypothetical protein [Bacteroidia bacterium]